VKLPLLFAVLLAAAAPASAAKRARRPSGRRAAHRAAHRRAPVRKAEPAPRRGEAALAVASSAMPPRDDAALAALGAPLIETPDGLLSAEPFRRSPAAGMGLRDGDTVLCVDRARAATRAEAAEGARRLAPEERSSLTVRRGLETLALSGDEVPAPKDFERGRDELSARETALAAASATRGDAAALDQVKAAAPLSWTLDAEQSVWVRFPRGLKADLSRDDRVEAEASTALTTDGALDFVAVPPGTKFRGRVIAASADNEIRAVRVAFDEMTLAGGHSYPILAYATALAGTVPALTRVARGGTVVAAAPAPVSGRRRGEDLILGEGARVRLRFVDPVTLVEPPSYWRAGPGLWLKTASVDGKSLFQVSHVVAGRGAEAAGLRVGDVVTAVDGRSASRLDFEDAIDRLYGAPGSSLSLDVRRDGQTATLHVQRGVKRAGGVYAPLPLPYSNR
jgi:hypothetical protein